MTALFGSAAVADSKNLVQFRTGKMHLRGTTVTADKRKGMLYIYQSDDSLMHFCWKDRTSGVVEDDLIIFPDDTEFKPVPQCTTGRAFVLKFKSSSRKFFFWMQEPKTDKDEEYCKKVNDLLNNPPAPSSIGGGSNSVSGLQPALASLGDQLGDSSLQRMLSNMDQNQLMQLLGMTGAGGAGGVFGSRDEPSTATTGTSASAATNSASASSSATPAPKADASAESAASKPEDKNTESQSSSKPADDGAAASSNATSKPAVQLSDLQNILSSMQIPGVGGQQGTHESVDLSTAFTTDALVPLLSDKKVQERLSPFLPEVKDLPTDSNDLRATIQSPQFKQALSIFSSALQSGQLAPLMQQFQLSSDAVQSASTGDIVGFMKALQESEKTPAESQPDEDMALD